MTKDNQNAELAAQEVLINIWQSIGRLSSPFVFTVPETDIRQLPKGYAEEMDENEREQYENDGQESRGLTLVYADITDQAAAGSSGMRLRTRKTN